MKIAFVSPYFNQAHVGGGEKHLIEIALVAAQKHQVSLCINVNPRGLTYLPHNAWSIKKYQQYYEQFIGKDLSSLNFVFSPLCTDANFWAKLWFTRKYDSIFYATDGSLFFSLAKRNYLHIQLPFNQPMSWLNKLKLISWHHINTNSDFTKRVVEKAWRINVNQVLYPVVNLEEFQSSGDGEKQKYIVSVGRFFRQLHSKRQDVLITIFRKLINQYPQQTKAWRLILVGGVEDIGYVKELKKKATGLPIEFALDISRRRLRQLLKGASIFWHAAGFEVDENINPLRVEHFGIATLEAMAAGAVPVVVGKGGQVEIMHGKLAQLLWLTKDECVDKTIAIIKDPLWESLMRAEASKRARNFDQFNFQKGVWQMLAS